jgi:hypothetical protein
MHDAVRPSLDPTTSDHVAFGDRQTWYRITGDIGSGVTPLVAVHGGPGCTHDLPGVDAAVAECRRGEERDAFMALVERFLDEQDSR